MDRKAIEKNAGKMTDSEFAELKGMVKPAINITANFECGEVEKVELTDEFKAGNSLFRADVLKDAIEQLQNLYENTVNEWNSELESAAVGGN